MSRRGWSGELLTGTTTCAPSGDQSRPEPTIAPGSFQRVLSGPPSAGTMSTPSPRCPRSLRNRRTNAMVRPSGDHAGNSPPAREGASCRVLSTPTDCTWSSNPWPRFHMKATRWPSGESAGYAFVPGDLIEGDDAERGWRTVLGRGAKAKGPKQPRGCSDDDPGAGDEPAKDWPGSPGSHRWADGSNVTGCARFGRRHRILRRRLHAPYIRDEPVTASGNRLDESRGGRRVTQCVPDLRDDDIEGGLELDEGVGRPERPTKLITCDELAGPRHEEPQDARGLILQGHAPAVASQLACRGIELEGPEPHERANGLLRGCSGGRRIRSDPRRSTGEAVHDWLRGDARVLIFRDEPHRE